MKFEEFFFQATNNRPYEYQTRLADADELPEILEIPTGCGKTDAAIIMWMWRRLHKCPNKTPRRLVYCLPMRTLVDQTAKRANEIVTKLKLEIKITVLMGGDTDNEWWLEPEKDKIIIGTQDMLLSRALNRGYGLSPYMWPTEFSMINNDCLWVMDEVQLMENGLPTSLQLQAFRNETGTCGKSHTVWMSATVNGKKMRTVNYTPNQELFRLGKTTEALEKIRSARKKLEPLEIKAKKTYDTNALDKILGVHTGGHTIIVVNRVNRAQELYREIKERVGIECTLIHSRFRPNERKKLNDTLLKMDEKDERITIATQAIEAGVDISARTLVTELAPITSLVQRFGRCNRRGEFDNASAYWIDLDDDASQPYSTEDLSTAREWLKNQKSASSKDIQYDEAESFHDAVLRRSDMVGLFDTAPDISGNYLDVSRFVRSSEIQTDVRVYWRSFHNKPDQDMEKARRDEICIVSISEFKEFLKNSAAWFYDHTDEDYSGYNWKMADIEHVRPGQLFLINSKDGRYSNEYGWSRTVTENVEEVDIVKNIKKRAGSDFLSLEEHTQNVVSQSKKILADLDTVNKECEEAVREAALYHDLGKSHHVFQHTMHGGRAGNDTVLAKSPHNGTHQRKNFRHEAASAIAYLKNFSDKNNADLVAYLIASHHGKIRITMRSSSKLKTGRNYGYLLGFPTKQQEDLPRTKLSSSVTVEKTQIDMSIASIGNGSGTSWLKMSLDLRDAYGIFRLAYMETLIRAADVGASKMEAESDNA